MMKKTQLMAWLSLASLVAMLLFGSCATAREQEVPEVEKLVLDKSLLTFANLGGKEMIKVTGPTEWTYIAQSVKGEWITVDQVDNQLTITVAPNTENSERKGELIVVGGGTQRKVEIHQSAADALLNFGDSEVQLSARTCEKTLVVQSNVEEWAFENPDVGTPWLKVEHNKGTNLFILKAEANLSHNPRSVELVAKAKGGEQFVLKVTQLGKIKYFLPYEPTNDYRDVDVLIHENERGFILAGYNPPRWNDFEKKVDDGQAAFHTPSEVMKVILYIRELGDIKYTMALLPLEVSDPKEMPEVKEYIALLEKEGYEFQNDMSQDLIKVYMRKDKKMMARIRISGNGVVVTFMPGNPQEKSYPTFATVPMGPKGMIDNILNPAVKYPEIEALEKQLGGKLRDGFPVMDEQNPELYRYAMFDVESISPENEGLRTYFFLTEEHKEIPNRVQTMSQFIMYFTKPELAIRSFGKRTYVTDEYHDLMEANGWEYDGQDNDLHNKYFIKRLDKDYVLAQFIAKEEFNDVFGGKPSLKVGYFKYLDPEAPAPAPSSSRSAEQVNKYGEKVSRAAAHHEAMMINRK